MGRATRWLKGLLGIKKPDPNLQPTTTPSDSGPDPPPSPPSKPSPGPSNHYPRSREKRRWGLVKSNRGKSSSSRHNADITPHQFRRYAAGETSPSPSSSAATSTYTCGVSIDDPTKHAIAVAAASAAAAEAAVAAAQAAAAVVRLTGSGRSNVLRLSGGKDTWAALVIQSHFRGYLARRALRALRGLVKLQALVRGRIMRKKAAETMRCMQAMLRAQARARVVRTTHLPVSPHSSGKPSHVNNPGPPTPEKFEQSFQSKKANRDQSPMFKRNSSRSGSRGQDRGCYSSSWSDPRMDEPAWEPPRDKILEIDPGKPNQAPPTRRRTLFESSSHSGLASDQISHSHSCTTSKDSTAGQAAISPTSMEVRLPHLNPLKLSSNCVNYDEDTDFCTAENSPQFLSVSSRRGACPVTPTKSDRSFSGLSGYSDCPSYMACTESSRAKMRSLSAPRQRPNYERTNSGKRWSAHHSSGFGDPRSSSQRASSGSSLHSSFASKAYPGSGRLDRLGMPLKTDTLVYYSGYLN